MKSSPDTPSEPELRPDIPDPEPPPPGHPTMAQLRAAGATAAISAVVSPALDSVRLGILAAVQEEEDLMRLLALIPPHRVEETVAEAVRRAAVIADWLHSGVRQPVSDNGVPLTPKTIVYRTMATEAASGAYG